MTARVALGHVRAEKGPFNWILFKPHRQALVLHNAGSLSLKEMHAHLPDDAVLYGLLRMGFGAGQFRRTKWVAVWWMGPSATALQRGMATGMQGVCLARIGSYSVTVTASSADELTLASVIRRVRAVAVIDGVGADSARGVDPADPFSERNFEAALAEEVEANRTFFGDGDSGGVGDMDVSGRAAADVAADVGAGRFNWATFGVSRGG